MSSTRQSAPPVAAARGLLRRPVLWLALALGGGCGGTREPPPARPAPAAEPEPEPKPEPEPAAAKRSGVLERQAVDAVLDAGPGAFLRNVEVSAVLEGGAFVGWRIVQFLPGELRFADYDLRPGDILRAVNGKRIVRPDDLHRLWESLRTADTLSILLERDGSPVELELVIR